MPRGQPDFGMYAPKTVTASLADMAELAVRLGSIVSYDRRGEVVFFDDFEGSILRWTVTAHNADGTAYLDAYAVRSGSQAVKMHTIDIANGRVWLSRYLPSLNSKRLGFEVSFSSLGANNFILVGGAMYDGAKYYEVQAKIDATAKALYVYNSTPAYEEVASDITIFSDQFGFHTVKLVFDYDLGYYVRLMFDQLEYDISDIALYSLPVVQSPFLINTMHLWNRASTGGDVWLDDYIFTQNEP